jgi:hypothetical protein
MVFVAFVVPPAPVTLRTTLYVPGVEKVLTTVAEAADVPSPRFQVRLVTVPVDVSAKVTVSGAVPVVWLAVKLATGAGSATVMVFLAVAVPPAPVTLRTTL